MPKGIAREDFLLDAAFRPHEHGLDVRPQARERFGERQRRHQVAAGPTPAKTTFTAAPGRARCWTSTPVATRATSRLDPP